jgi:UDPglucose 6-dehydrogenase
MKVGVIGTGYVGLTTGLCLAHLGHRVSCLDVDAEKINVLRSGLLPIHEPHLAQLLSLCSVNIEFTTDPSEALVDAEVTFICVGTPSLSDGNPDLQFVKAASEQIGKHIGNQFMVVVNKSTVPVGCANWVEEMVREAYEADHNRKANGLFAIASNPEFLREGSALYDSLYPDRVVIGSDHPNALEVLQSLYRPIIQQDFPAPDFLPRPDDMKSVPVVTTNLTSAELVKYAANAFLSVKISFANEIAQLAERVGADIRHVVQGIGLDSRIGHRFLQAGLGWGGSCFGKDTAALLATAREYGTNLPIVHAARVVNAAQREHVIATLLSELKILKGRTIGMLGLAFKPNTDDLRDAPAIDIAKRLIERGARVRAHDPVALRKARADYGEVGIQFCQHPESVADEADALILVTEWPQYRNLRWKELASAMRFALIFDGRNFLDRRNLESAGFRYIGVGLGTNMPRKHRNSVQERLPQRMHRSAHTVAYEPSVSLQSD